MTEREDKWESVAARHERALEVMAHMQQAAAERGLDKMTMEEIEEEIALVRLERRRLRRSLSGEQSNSHCHAPDREANEVAK